ncbi:L domain-like protein [Neocallimastix lanati (nom. inval.)]|jgi:hypothetical protein|uniref:L domain-like protein n=1 Tax=Neocallimastix californiae TaxID=1754190 RepID=A0A1Y2AK43_9FUNG|nr:L domain-like protein [Neocallimastix sp. JGI-2020a]ORY22948.1 L domain-like protein [Neocallimastix californiae]|eukprot:ORY22948.1 L domain-like protein [Neocallimastix californiae]
MKISTLFTFFAFFCLTLAKDTPKTTTITVTSATTSSKATAKASKETANSRAKAIESKKVGSDCEILKDVFSGLKATYPWFKDINNCCNKKAEFTCVNNKVEAIKLNSVKLNMTLSEKIGELTNLKQLSLSQTGLTGSIPKSLFKISNLEILELNGNKLDGTINNEFGNLKKLKTLNLNNNNLSGAVPESLFQIKSLENVNLANNKLTGQIPEMKNSLKTCSFSGTSLCTKSKLSCDKSLNVCDVNDKKDTSNKNIITYIIIGAIIVVILLIICCCCCCRSNGSGDKKKNRKLNSKDSLSSLSSSNSSSSSASSSNENKLGKTREVNEYSTFEPLPEITRDEGKIGSDDSLFVKKEKSFVLLEIPESVKNDFVEDLVDANPTLISPFLTLKEDMKTLESKSSKSSLNSSHSSCSSCSCSSSGSSVYSGSSVSSASSASSKSTSLKVPTVAVDKPGQPIN